MITELVRGELFLRRRSQREARFFILRSDRIEYHLVEEDALKRTKPRGFIKIRDMARWRRTNAEFCIVLKSEQNLKLCVNSAEELIPWADALTKLGVCEEIADEDINLSVVSVEDRKTVRLSVDGPDTSRCLKPGDDEETLEQHFAESVQTVQKAKASKDNGSGTKDSPTAKSTRRTSKPRLHRLGSKPRQEDTRGKGVDEWNINAATLRSILAFTYECALRIEEGMGGDERGSTEDELRSESAFLQTEALCEGMLEVVKKRTSCFRFFALFPTYVAYYSDHQDFEQGNRPQGKLFHENIESIQGGDDLSVNIIAGGCEFNLQAPDIIQQRKWVRCWAQAVETIGHSVVSLSMPAENFEEKLQYEDGVEKQQYEGSADDLTKVLRTVSSDEGLQAIDIIGRGEDGVEKQQYEDGVEKQQYEEGSADDLRKVLGTMSPDESSQARIPEAEDVQAPVPLLAAAFEVEVQGQTWMQYAEIIGEDLIFYGMDADVIRREKPVHVPLSDVEWLEETFDGFRIFCRSGEIFGLTGPSNGSREDWVTNIRHYVGKRAAEPEVKPNCNVARMQLEGSTDFVEVRIAFVTGGFYFERLSDGADLLCVKDVQEVTLVSNGFRVKTIHGEAHFLTMDRENSLEKWINLMDHVCLDGFGKRTGDCWKRTKVEKIVEGVVEVQTGNQILERHAICFTDKLVLSENLDTKSVNDTSKTWTIWPSQVKKVRVQDEGIEIDVENHWHSGRLDLFFDDPLELDLWFEAIRCCFARHPVPVKTNAENKRADDAPPSSDSRVSTFFDVYENSNPFRRPLCHGSLWISERGKLTMKYAVLFPVRFDVWDCAEDILKIQTPKTTIKVQDITNIDSLCMGFILEFSHNGKHRIAIHIRNKEDLRCWTLHLTQAFRQCLSCRRRPSQKPNERLAKSISPGRTSKPKVPRCASLGHQLKQSEPEGGVRHNPPASHAVGKGVVINTHVRKPNAFANSKCMPFNRLVQEAGVLRAH